MRNYTNFIPHPTPHPSPTKRRIVRVTKLFQRIRWTGYAAFMEHRRYDGKSGLTRTRRT